MEKSANLSNIAKALALFQMKMEKVSKDSTNPFFKSKYASLSNILEAIQIPLAESGLCFSQFPSDNHGLSTILLHAESGEFLESTYYMKPVKDDPQGIGSTITYQRRYALASVLGLNIDDDDDGNAGSQPETDKNNHTSRTVDERPWLTEILLNQALARVYKGEAGVYENIDKAFRMKKEYRDKLKAAKPVGKGVPV